MALEIFRSFLRLFRSALERRRSSERKSTAVEQEVAPGPIADQRGRDFTKAGDQGELSQIEAPPRRHLSVASSHGRFFGPRLSLLLSFLPSNTYSLLESRVSRFVSLCSSLLWFRSN